MKCHLFRYLKFSASSLAVFTLFILICKLVRLCLKPYMMGLVMTLVMAIRWTTAKMIKLKLCNDLNIFILALVGLSYLRFQELKSHWDCWRCWWGPKRGRIVSWPKSTFCLFFFFSLFVENFYGLTLLNYPG